MKLSLKQNDKKGFVKVKLAVFKYTDNCEIYSCAFQRWSDVTEQVNEKQQFSPSGFTL